MSANNIYVTITQSHLTMDKWSVFVSCPSGTHTSWEYFSRQIAGAFSCLLTVLTCLCAYVGREQIQCHLSNMGWNSPKAYANKLPLHIWARLDLNQSTPYNTSQPCQGWDKVTHSNMELHKLIADGICIQYEEYATIPHCSFHTSGHMSCGSFQPVWILYWCIFLLISTLNRLLITKIDFISHIFLLVWLQV